MSDYCYNKPTAGLTRTACPRINRKYHLPSGEWQGNVFLSHSNQSDHTTCQS